MKVSDLTEHNLPVNGQTYRYPYTSLHCLKMPVSVNIGPDQGQDTGNDKTRSFCPAKPSSASQPTASHPYKWTHRPGAWSSRAPTRPATQRPRPHMTAPRAQPRGQRMRAARPVPAVSLSLSPAPHRHQKRAHNGRGRWECAPICVALRPSAPLMVVGTGRWWQGRGRGRGAQTHRLGRRCTAGAGVAAGRERHRGRGGGAHPLGTEIRAARDDAPSSLHFPGRRHDPNPAVSHTAGISIT